MFLYTRSIKFIIVYVVHHLVELVHQVLLHIISYMLAVLHLLHFSILPGRLFEKCPFLLVVHQLEVALVVMFNLAFAR